MAGKRQLPPVAATEELEATSLNVAFLSGSRVGELRAKRRILIAHIENENTLARDLAPLMRQDNELARELELLRLETEGDDVGDATDAPDEAFTA